jgi:hypothetical protein
MKEGVKPSQAGVAEAEEGAKPSQAGAAEAELFDDVIHAGG